MNAKIKLYYEAPEELQAVVLRLGELVKQVKQAPQRGRYRLAYIEIKRLPCSAKNGIMEQ